MSTEILYGWMLENAGSFNRFVYLDENGRKVLVTAVTNTQVSPYPPSVKCRMVGRVVMPHKVEVIRHYGDPSPMWRSVGTA